jgi:1-acyl-sn-glycerol-3-phosphate acyltransferase
MRSAIFNTVFFYGFTAVVAILCVPLTFLPSRQPIVWVLHWWARGIVQALRIVAGVTLEFRGQQNLTTDGPSLMASKHHSFCDGILILSLIPDLAIVATKDLEDYPLFGRILKKLEMILVDTCGGGSARDNLSEAARMAYDKERHLLIYPEGQLVPVGERERYKNGIYHLYAELDLPVTPIATNVGMCWQCAAWKKKPGAMVVEFMAPIATGLDQDTFMRVLEDRIEAQTARLVEEAS